MNRLLAPLWIASTFLLSSCTSEPEVLYTIVDDLVVIDSESWSSRQDSPINRWKSVSSDAGQVAQLGRVPASQAATQATNQTTRASYNIDFNDTGVFYLWIRARLVGDSKNPVLNVSIAPTSDNFARQVAGFNNQWQWISVDNNQNTLSVNIVSPVLHSLGISTNSTTLQIDKIILTTEPGFLPTGAGPDATFVQIDDGVANEDAVTDQPDALFADPINDQPPNAVLVNEITEQDPAEPAITGSENTGAETTGADIKAAEITEQPDDNQANDSSADQIGIVNRQPEVQIQYAGSAATELILKGTQIQLFADATDDNLPTTALYTYWTKVAGPGDVGFSDQTDPAPVVSFTAPGVYKLQVSANDTELYKNAMITITVEAHDLTENTVLSTDSVMTIVTDNDAIADEGVTSSVNTEDTSENAAVEAEYQSSAQDATPVSQAPSVSISGPTTAVTGESLQLTAITDHIDPNTPVYHYWNQIHGTGTASIINVQGQSTDVIFDQPGRYVLQVSASVDTSYANATIEIDVADANSAVDESHIDSVNSNPPDFNQMNIGPAHSWQKSFASGSPQHRHETSGVAVNGKLYVIGGRGHQPIDVYDSASNNWSQAARPPLEMHHFQAVAIDSTIYVVGASTCCYPLETNIANVYEFDTQTGTWSKGAAIPANRLRGSTAAAVYNNKIYIVGGNTRGHSGGAVNWFDEFDPATGQWKQLADAPDARDHATIAVVGDQLVVAGGRRSAYPDTFGNTVGRTNIYDLKQQRWQTAANIPTQRAGTMAVGIGSELVVIGGESKNSRSAHNAVEAFDIHSGNWRALSPLPTPRHGGAAAVINNDIHVVAGSMQIGGAPETNAHEILKQ